MQIMEHEDPQTTIHTLASENILTSLPENLSGIERIREVFRREVMSTVINGRFSGMYKICQMLGLSLWSVDGLFKVQ